MARESNITVATGEKGTGKTYTTLWETVVPYAKGMLNGNIPRKVLIFDTQGEYHPSNNTENNIYPKTDKHKKLTLGKPLTIKALSVNDVKAYASQQRVEIRRISPFHTENVLDKKGNIIASKGDMMLVDYKIKALIKTVNDFSDGLLVIEDLRALFGDNIPHNIVSLIVSNRHKNMDIVWHLQSVGRMLPQFWENVNYVRFHKELGSIDYHQNKLQERYPIFKICDILVKNVAEAGFPRYYLWINNGKKKIVGNYTKEQLMWCIEKYVKSNRSSYSEYEREMGDNKRAKYSFQQCIELAKRDLFKEYYGNGA